MDIIDKDALLGNGYNALAIYECRDVLDLIGSLIIISEEYVLDNEPEKTWSHEGICFLFAKSIVYYARMAYDNMILGHFDAAKMIMRSIVENNVCLDIMQQYKDEELWKYYIVQSYKKSLTMFGRKLTDEHNKLLEEVCYDFGIEKEFLEKSKKNNSKKEYAYIDRDYGWTYKVNSNLTFSGLCDLIDANDHKDFKFMSMYSHGTTLYLKMCDGGNIESIMNMISCLYIGLYRLISNLYPECINEEFDEVVETLEDIMFDYIEYTDDIFDNSADI